MRQGRREKEEGINWEIDRERYKERDKKRDIDMGDREKEKEREIERERGRERRGREIMIENEGDKSLQALYFKLLLRSLSS